MHFGQNILYRAGELLGLNVISLLLQFYDLRLNINQIGHSWILICSIRPAQSLNILMHDIVLPEDLNDGQSNDFQIKQQRLTLLILRIKGYFFRNG